MDNCLISIIVPVYKAEDFLPKCINSILAQTYTNFELLLIDDGSPDNSGRICDEYAEKDTRIRVFHKENGGVSSARNLGLKEAKGEWICWVDADDWVEYDMLEKLLKKATEDNADMVMFDYKWVGKEWNSNNIIEDVIHHNLDTNNKYTIIKDLVANKLYGALWFKFCKKSLYTNNEIWFINGADYAEDYACSVKLIHYANKISYIPISLYYYNRINSNSILNSMTNPEIIIKTVQAIETNNDSTDIIMSKYSGIEKERKHRQIASLSLYLEVDNSYCRELWLKKDIGLLDIINDKYLSKGYKFKCIMIKLRLFYIYSLYVKLMK